MGLHTGSPDDSNIASQVIKPHKWDVWRLCKATNATLDFCSGLVRSRWRVVRPVVTAVRSVVTRWAPASVGGGAAAAVARSPQSEGRQADIRRAMPEYAVKSFQDAPQPLLQHRCKRFRDGDYEVVIYK
jgi:hypothetical protein